MECSTFTFESDHTSLTLLVIYKQPTSITITFCEELATILEEGITSMKSNIMIIGDFNIHIEHIANLDTITFSDFLDSFNLQNHVNFPTYIAKHHLDLCITEWDSSPFQSISKDHLILIHNFIHAKLKAQKPYVSPKRISYRKLKSINHGLFKVDLPTKLTECLSSISSCSARDLVEIYNHACTKILNEHAPVTNKVISLIHNQPWFNENIRKEIQLCRKKEALLYRNPCTYTFLTFHNQRSYCANLIRSSQKSYYNNFIYENKKDYKTLFNLTNSLLGKSDDLLLPSIRDLKSLAEDFIVFFGDEVDMIMKNYKRVWTNINQSSLNLSLRLPPSLTNSNQLMYLK